MEGRRNRPSERVVRPRKAESAPKAAPVEEVEEEEEQRTPILSRRSFIAGAAAVGTGLFLENNKDILHPHGADAKGKPAHEKSALQEKNERDMTELQVQLEHAKAEDLPTGIAGGEKLAGLEVIYLKGESSSAGHRLGETISVNGPRAFFALYNAKLKRLDEHGKEDPTIESEAVERSLDYALRWNEPERFAPHAKDKRAEAIGRTTLEGVRKDIEHKLKPIRDVFSDPDYKNMSQVKSSFEYAYRLTNEAEISTLRSLINRISTDMMLSYSITELLWGTHGERNMRIYDLMLRTVGKHFIAGIPSEGDLIESFGQYQMTNYGVRDTSADTDVWVDKEIVRNGASKPNSLLPDDLQLPKHLEDLHSYEDHSAIAFLYAVNILAAATSKVPKPHLEYFKEMTDTTLLSFIATSHNNPSAAWSAMSAWLREQAQGRNEHSYKDFCSIKIRSYAEKSIANFDALNPDSNALAEIDHRKVEVARDDAAVREALEKIPKRGEGKHHKK